MLLGLADALRDEGVKVQEISGWQSRSSGGIHYNNNGKKGVILHHTASSISGGPAPALGIVTYGRSDLPGPLANVLTGRDLVARVVAAGKANHAGAGGPFRTVAASNANYEMAGIEAENNGIGEIWTPQFLEFNMKVAAAILKLQKLDASWCIGHKEWTSRKPDPSTSMVAFRLMLAEYMGGLKLDPEEREKLFNIWNVIVGLGKSVGVPVPDSTKAGEWEALGREIGNRLPKSLDNGVES